MGDRWDRPAIPEILALWLDRDRRRVWARRSETKEAEEVLSRRARASTDEPSGLQTKMQHVIIRVSIMSPVAVFETMGFVPTD